ncbi:hypothetical protein [Niabella aquatica]
MGDKQTKEAFQVNDKKQMLVLVRYKPASAMEADSMLGGVTAAVQGAVDKVEDAAASIPGLDLFFKEEKEKEKHTEKAYTYYNDYSAWDEYFKKMKNELANRLNTDNETLVFDFDASDAKARENEGRRLLAQVKSKVSAWKDYTACFHFVGLGQGGNVANECISGLIKEPDFKNKWWVQSIIYVGTPLYKNRHTFKETEALRGKGKIYSYGNAYDLTQHVISYFEPYDQLLKMIAESNANMLSVFTGKIKAQLVATLGRLLSIEGFGTGHDNDANINKLAQCKNDAEGLVGECVEACKNVLNAFPDLVKPPDLPKFDEMLKGFDAVPRKSADRLEKFIDELKKVREGTSLDTSRISLGKLFNFLCPLVDQLTAILRLFTVGSETTDRLFEKVMEKAGIEKVLAPSGTGMKNLPVDPYINKAVEMAKAAQKQEKELKQQAGEEKSAGDAPRTKEKLWYDQANVMINNTKACIAAATEKDDIDVKSNATSGHSKQKIAEAVTAMLLPMMPSKKKFYGKLLEYIPLGGINSMLGKLTGDAAFAPLKNLVGKLKDGFDFDEGTEEEPGLKKSLQYFDKELARIKGFLNRNNYPVHQDANSLYFIYNSHNLMLGKTYGEILNTIDKETGYLGYMQSIGYTNFYNLEKNEYQGKGAPQNSLQPVQVFEEEAQGT